VVDSGKLRFIVIDGSTVQEPGATGTTYRLHIAIDMINLSLHQVEVTTDQVGESLDHYPLQEGDVVILDRGYNQPKSLVPFIDQGGEVVLRYNPHGMNLYEAVDGEDSKTMQKIDWENLLLTLNGQAGYIPAWICHGNKRIRVYVHALPLPPEKAAEARRKAKQRAKEKGRTASKATLHISGWVLVMTSLPTELLDTQTAAALYRVRWQVELVIKRLKSLLDINLLRARKDSQLAELYLHGKLLYAAVIEKQINQRFAEAKRTLDVERQLTDWRLWRNLADDLKSALKACFPAQERFVTDTLKSLAERRRKRQLQGLPAPILTLLQHCRDKGLSLV
jgi:hypothetical protein